MLNFVQSDKRSRLRLIIVRCFSNREMVKGNIGKSKALQYNIDETVSNPVKNIDKINLGWNLTC